MKAPEKIYLQEVDEVGDGHTEVTWCEDRITDDDVEYVRADIVAELESQVERLEITLEVSSAKGANEMGEHGKYIAALESRIDEYAARIAELEAALQRRNAVILPPVVRPDFHIEDD